MDRRIVVLAICCLVSLPLAFAQDQAPADKLVLEIPDSQWFEGLLERVTVSPDGNWALLNRVSESPGRRDIQLYSLKFGNLDHDTLILDLDRIDNAVFYGSRGALARLGERASEQGWFFPNSDSEALSSLPMDAIPVFAPDPDELAYYRTEAPSQAIFIKARGQFRDYELGGRILGMAFSPTGDFFYDLMLQPSGESSLVRINVNTGDGRIVAKHLDAPPQSSHIAISPDGRRIYLALASDSAPDNAARQQPQADRWLKIYELDPAAGTRRVVVESPGHDNTNPVIVGNNLYWTRTLYSSSVVVVPFAGGKAKEIAANGLVPMWSPDSKRLAYSFGGARLADWRLDYDDAVVALDDQANLAAPPVVIVSGNNEDDSPAWSPDGNWIAFHSRRSSRPVPVLDDPAGTDDIYLRHADDTHAPEIRLTDFGWNAGPAFWSPDGKKLLFTSWDRNGQPGVNKLYVVSMDLELGRALSVEALPLSPEVHNVDWAAWSPDGASIAIEANRGGDDRSLWTVHSDGSHGLKVLDYKCATQCGLDWSPDGKTIVYSALAADHEQLFIVPSFGGVSHQLTQDSGNLLHPRLSPDGKWIACTRILESKQIWRRPLP